jgi:hypothetical protein
MKINSSVKGVGEILVVNHHITSHHIITLQQQQQHSDHSISYMSLAKGSFDCCRRSRRCSSLEPPSRMKGLVVPQRKFLLRLVGKLIPTHDIRTLLWLLLLLLIVRRNDLLILLKDNLAAFVLAVVGVVDLAIVLDVGVKRIISIRLVTTTNIQS